MKFQIQLSRFNNRPISFEHLEKHMIALGAVVIGGIALAVFAKFGLKALSANPRIPQSVITGLKGVCWSLFASGTAYISYVQYQMVKSMVKL